MAIQHSPALPPIRPGLLDPSRQAEYPILLGKTLADRTITANKLMNVRYNWKSKQIPQRQVITESRALPASYKLVVREGTSEPYKYSGTTDPKSTDTDSSYLALVFDKDKSAFVLESISSSLNFNLTSATTKPNIEQLPQVETVHKPNQNITLRQQNGELPDEDEDAADGENPYDYRHFLAEATREAEAGNDTPKPPSTAIASPTPGASRVVTGSRPNTPVESAFIGSSKRRKVESKSAPRGVPKNQPTTNQSKAKSRTNVGASKGRAGHKSAEKITSSDDEKGTTWVTHGKRAKTPNATKSQKYPSSPQIIVDEASDLIIDMGSPPLKAQRKHKINPDAFSSHSGAHSRANTASVSPQGKNERGDSSKDAEGDVDMEDGEDDEDVEDLALPSPRETRAASNAMSRVTQDAALEDDDEDDGLAAELEAVFDQEDAGESGTVGLGISGGHGQVMVQNEEESEVSEEE